MSDGAMRTMQQAPDGSWHLAEPIGWQEEHGRIARALFWLRGIEHCNAQEGRRWRRCDVCARRLSRARRKLRLSVCSGPCYAAKHAEAQRLSDTEENQQR